MLAALYISLRSDATAQTPCVASDPLIILYCQRPASNPMSSLDSFRAQTRSWLEENCPESMRGGQIGDEVTWGGRRATYKNPEAKTWLDRMAERGWTAPTWPREYGGGGLSQEEATVLRQELLRIKANPALSSFGISMLGPVLLEYGNEQQKQAHLPKIVRGEIRWCQGYSEPGAGSDLASLQTRAEDRGDHFLVNGSKTWTSYANFADWIFCLVRTDLDAPKHQGISFLLFDMESEGVSTAPIRLISGASPFCETFFEDVRVSKENLVGKLNHGWEIAKRLLQHERAMIANIGGVSAEGIASDAFQDRVKAAAGERDGRIANAPLRDKVARHLMNDHAFSLTLERAREEARSGHANAALSSMFKYYGSEQNKRKYEILMEAGGLSALGWKGSGFSPRELATTRSWLRSKANSIEGGTSEVQLNVIAKRVLGLPDE